MHFGEANIVKGDVPGHKGYRIEDLKDIMVGMENLYKGHVKGKNLTMTMGEVSEQNKELWNVRMFKDPKTKRFEYNVVPDVSILKDNILKPYEERDKITSYFSTGKKNPNLSKEEKDADVSRAAKESGKFNNAIVSRDNKNKNGELAKKMETANQLMSDKEFLKINNSPLKVVKIPNIVKRVEAPFLGLSRAEGILQPSLMERDFSRTGFLCVNGEYVKPNSIPEIKRKELLLKYKAYFPELAGATQDIGNTALLRLAENKKVWADYTSIEEI